MDDNLRIDATEAREVLQLAFDDAFQFDGPLLVAVLETLVGADANYVIEIDILGGELDSHDGPH